MSGLKRRLTRVRAATDDEGTPQASAASEPVDATTDAQQGGSGMPANGTAPTAAEEQPTAVLPPGEEAATVVAPEADRDLPAGVDPGELAAVPSSARRSRLRHRLRYLRGVRELLLRDIGGFYYEAQRAEGGVEPHQRLLDAKTARLTRLDDEMRELETRLEEPHPETVLRVPGVGGSCPVCGEVHASDARYCSRCGTALDRRAAASAPATGPVPAPTTGESKQTTASLWGRPKRPEPARPEDATLADAQERSATDEPDGAAEASRPDDAAETSEPDGAAEVSRPDDAAETSEPDGAAEATRPDEATADDSAAETSEPDTTTEAPAGSERA